MASFCLTHNKEEQEEFFITPKRNGFWFSFGFNCHLSNHAEFLALKRRLEIASNIGIIHFDINTDLQVLIQFITKNIVSINLIFMLNDCIWMLHQFRKFKFSYIPGDKWSSGLICEARKWFTKLHCCILPTIYFYFTCFQ